MHLSYYKYAVNEETDIIKQRKEQKRREESRKRALTSYPPTLPTYSNHRKGK